MAPLPQTPEEQSQEASMAPSLPSPHTSCLHRPPHVRNDVVVPIEDTSVDAQLSARDGSDWIRNLTFQKPREEGSPSSSSVAHNSLQPAQQASSPENPNLWRGVSADYLQNLEFVTGENPVSALPIKKRRVKSFDFRVPRDPPTQLIENFLQLQAASGNLCLDMDMDMMEKLPAATMLKDVSLLRLLEELSDDANPITSGEHGRKALEGSLPTTRMNPGLHSSPRSTGWVAEQQYGISFDPTQVLHCSQEGLNSSLSFDGAPNLKQSNRGSSHDGDGYSSDSFGDDEAQIQGSSARSSLNRIQTRSRLSDLAPSPRRREAAALKPHTQSAQLRSGLLQKAGLISISDEEEDDPLKDTDIPESFRKHKWNFITAFQWTAFFLIMGWLVCSLTVPALKNMPLWSMAMWKWALLIFLLFCGRLVSGWVIRILVIILEMNFLLRKRVLYFVYGLRKGVQNCLWFAFAVFTWRLVFDPKVETTTNSKVLPYVTKSLNFFLISAIVWLVKIFSVKIMASSFHVNTYFERIRESLFGQWVLETLSGPSVVEMEQETKLIEELNNLQKAGAKVPEAIMLKASTQNGKSGMITLGKSGLMIGGKKSGMMGTGKSGFMGKSGLIGDSGVLRAKSQQSIDTKAVQEEGITIDDLHRLNQKNISAWNMKRLMKFVRYRGIYSLAHVIDQTAAEIQGDTQDMEIHSEWQAKAVAKKIFKNVAKPGARYIVQDDLLRFIHELEVEKALSLFEGASETGKISKNALKDFAVHVVRERRALSLSLNDTKTAVKKLHRIVDVIVGLVILIVCLLVMGLTTTHLLLVISSQLVLVVFIFGNTCRNVFEAIVFLFVMHPFDVGDRCIVDGNQLVVEEMNILSTLFMRNDGEKIWYPNALLATKYIVNYYRTPDTGDAFDFSIDANTPSEKISLLKEKIGKYIASKPSHWTRDYNLIVKGIEDGNKMRMQLMVNHTINYSDDLERQIRKSDLILDVKRMLQELGIVYRLLPQEVYLANSSMSVQEDTHPHLKVA